jgi:hypothetical protein
VITEGRIQNSCGEVLLSPAKGNRGAFPRRIASCREYDAFFVRRAAGQRAPEALIPDPARGWMNCNAIRCRSFVVFGKSVAASPALSTFPNRFSCSERSRSGSASTRKTTASRTACSPISGNGFPCSIFTEANSSSSPLALAPCSWPSKERGCNPRVWDGSVQSERKFRRQELNLIIERRGRGIRDSCRSCGEAIGRA